MNLILSRESERALSTAANSDFSDISSPTKLAVADSCTANEQMKSPVPQPISNSKGTSFPNRCAESSLGYCSQALNRSLPCQSSRYLQAVCSSGGIPLSCHI